jgi:methylglyoxal/glyoxal reductase
MPMISKITDIKGTAILNNGIEMPYLGLGVFLAKEGTEVINAVKYALEAGYRHIDTAALYQNERGVGKAMKGSKIPRGEIFITTKVWNNDQGYDPTLKAFDESLEKLDTDFIDLYLIHWPVKGKYKETWRALEEIYNQGRARAIGVSNFLIHHLDDLLQSAKIIPMVNQVEFHPFVVQQDLLDYCKAHKIQFEAWSPLMQGKIFDIKLLNELAKKYNRTVAQIVLRWDLQKGVVTIPKSVRKEIIISNSKLFDFCLSEEDINAIDELDKNRRLGAHPDHFNF